MTAVRTGRSYSNKKVDHFLKKIRLDISSDSSAAVVTGCF